MNGRITQAELKVPALSLDDYCEGTMSFNFIKIDVEGAGGHVLSGMKRILESSRTIIFMEFHTESEWSARTILTSAGYNIFNLNGDLISMDEDAKREYHCFAIPIGCVLPSIN